MGVFSMFNQIILTLKNSVNSQPQHISEAVEKMDQTIERLSSSSVSLFKTDYLE